MVASNFLAVARIILSAIERLWAFHRLVEMAPKLSKIELGYVTEKSDMLVSEAMAWIAAAKHFNIDMDVWTPTFLPSIETETDNFRYERIEHNFLGENVCFERKVPKEAPTEVIDLTAAQEPSSSSTDAIMK